MNILEQMRLPLERLEIGVQGARRDDEPPAYTAITIVVRAWGGDLDPANLTRAVELPEEEYCSVSAMLAGTAQISTRIELNGKLVLG